MIEFLWLFGQIFSIVCYWFIFKKCNEKSWKAIIPFYNTYIRYKLFYNKKVFIPYMVINIVLSYSFTMFLMLGAQMMEYFNPDDVAFGFNSIPANIINTASLYFFIIIISSIILLVLEIILNVYMAKSFKKSVGFTLGLVFLNIIFVAILAFFDDNIYYGNMKNINLEGNVNV